LEGCDAGTNGSAEKRDITEDEHYLDLFGDGALGR
jgi:hypothetical protein